MGRGSLAGALIACLVLATTATGCQKLYGGSPERLKNPERKKKPDDPDIAATPVKYVEDCTANFRDDPKLVRVNSGLANQLVGDGDTAMQNANKAKDAASQAELIKVSIDKYRNALIKDPYNHEATLKLALAYDKVVRKGCVMAMLRRLDQLAQNPKFKREAESAIDELEQQSKWFAPYRKDALRAVGRTGP